MTTNKFKINPCKACKKNYDITDINNINQCCYDTLSSFEGNVFPDNPNCNKCVQESISKLGRDPCEFRPAGTPSWNQVPHYFPALLEEENDIQSAKDKCIEACKTNRYSAECEKNCQIDSDAVETIENYTLNQKKFGQPQNMLEKLLSNDYVYKFVVIGGILLSVFLIIYFVKSFST